jgi:pentatricopeptide repeat protein
VPADIFASDLSSSTSSSSPSFVLSDPFKQTDSPSKDLEPVFYVLMNAYVELGLYDKFNEMLQRLSHAGVTPGPVTFGLILKSLLRQGDWKQAQLMWYEIQSSGISANTLATSILSEDLVSSIPQIGSAPSFSLLSSSSQTSVGQNIDSDILSSSPSSSQVSVKGWQIYDWFAQLGISLTLELFSLIINCNNILQTPSSAFSSSSSSTNKLSNSPVNDPKAYQLLSEMEDPDQYMCDLMISAYYSSNNCLDVLSTLKLFHSHPRLCVHVKEHHFCRLIELYFHQKKPKEALAVFQSMTTSSTPSPSSTAALDTSSSSSSSQSTARVPFLQSPHSLAAANSMFSGVEPSAGLWETMLKGLRLAGKHEEALLLWRQLQTRSGLAPLDAKGAEQVLRLFRDANDRKGFDEARKVLQEAGLPVFAWDQQQLSPIDALSELQSIFCGL